MQIWNAYVAELGLLSFAGYLWQRFIQRRKILHLRVAGLNKPVCIRNQPSDHALFTQLFIQQEYGKPVNHRVERIIDCGANIGLAALYFIRQYPGAAITCIEPDADNFSILKMNTAHYKNINCYRKAVWNKEECLNIFGRSRGAAGLMVKKTGTGEERETEGIVLSSLISPEDCVDILKIDIEGSEKQVLLEGDTAWAENVRTMFVELHEDIHPGITETVTRKFSGMFSMSRAGEYHVFEKIK